MDNCNVYGYVTGIVSGLLVVSEVLGIVKKVPANGILHVLYLCVKSLVQRPNETVVDMLKEVLIDQESPPDSSGTHEDL